MECNTNLEQILFKEIQNALEKKSEILEIDFNLEVENDRPKIFSIIEDKNWGIQGIFFKIKNQEFYYVINTEISEPFEIVNGLTYPKISINLNVISTQKDNTIFYKSKSKPFNIEIYDVHSDLDNVLRSFISFNFPLKPDYLEGQILEFLNFLDDDREYFQELLKLNMGILSIGIPNADFFSNKQYLSTITAELIKQLASFNLSIQFGEIL